MEMKVDKTWENRNIGTKQKKRVKVRLTETNGLCLNDGYLQREESNRTTATYTLDS